MTTSNTNDPVQDLECPVCGARGKALLGPDSERRLSPPRLKCRKCEEDYWENQRTGMLQQEIE